MNFNNKNCKNKSCVLALNTSFATGNFSGVEMAQECTKKVLEGCFCCSRSNVGGPDWMWVTSLLRNISSMPTRFSANGTRTLSRLLLVNHARAALAVRKLPLTAHIIHYRRDHIFIRRVSSLEIIIEKSSVHKNIASFRLLNLQTQFERNSHVDR